MESKTTDNSVPREIDALLSGERLILRETKPAATPFGVGAIFVSCLRKIDLIGKVRQWMTVCWRSPTRIDPTHTFTAFPIAELTGGQTLRPRRVVAGRWRPASAIGYGVVSYR